MATQSFKYDIPLLDRDTRFALWQIKMRDVLASMDLDDALLGMDKMPSSLTKEEKQKMDRKALSTIRLRLSNNILQEVMKETTSAALWLKLEAICMTKSLTSKLSVKQRLYSHRMPEGGSLLEHLASFKDIITDLESLEMKYEDEDLGLILLCSLPSSYATFRDTILYSRDSLTLEEVYEALHSKEKMKSMVSIEGSSSHGEGLTIRGRNSDRDSKPNRSRSKSKGRYKSCKYCKKSGHDISECYKLQNKEKMAANNQSKNGDSNATTSAEKRKGSEVLVALAGCVQTSDA